MSCRGGGGQRWDWPTKRRDKEESEGSTGLKPELGVSDTGKSRDLDGLHDWK